MEVKQKRIFLWKEYGVLIGFFILCLIISVATPNFMTTKNILNLLRQSSIIGIIAAGMTVVIISGNFDVSVGMTAAIAGAITMKLVVDGMPLVLAILISLVACMLIGFANGVLVAKIGIPSLIATMAMVGIIKGAMLIYTGGYPITSHIPFLDTIGNDYFLGIPNPVMLFLAIVILVGFILKYTCFGKYVYAVGANVKAARLSGINVDAIKIKVFLFNAVLAGVAGIVLIGRMGTASPTAGDGYDMDAIASVVIGGTSVAGGVGSVSKTVIGVLLMSVISNSFNLLGVDMYFQYIFKGMIILLAVGIDSYQKKKKEYEG